ncbi:MAG TPA: sulfite exporter TauE/SafE family protein [Pyrinomonadaceae bacterium]
MKYLRSACKRTPAALLSASLVVCFAAAAAAHPLGNFTVNRFARIEAGGERVRLRYVVDMAEIPAFQALQAADADGDGKQSTSELEAYLTRAAAQYLGGIRVTVDGAPLPLREVSKKITTPAGNGGLPTLRVELDYEGALPAGAAGAARRLRFEDVNNRERTGWHEIVVAPAAGVNVYDSTAFGNAVTDELRAYPEDLLSAPLDERAAELSFTTGVVPEGAKPLLARDGRPAARPSRDRLAELIAVPEVTPGVALLALLMAVGLGALHALSPGHGKTVVGAYLVGSRGTPKHAAFLGLTVTITHTLGVFALGLVTLFAAQYVVPERLFPVLSLVSGGIVLFIGLSLFARRLRAALSPVAHAHHGHSHSHDHGDGHGHDHHHDGDPTVPHSHDGGSVHTHLPPGADGAPVTWRSLLALGISGGLLPCPSALVVLLSAISLHRVGFGLLLVVAFSVGLAAALTGVGLAFLYAGRLFKRPAARLTSGRLVRVLPALSALVIVCVGAAICYEALGQAGFHPAALLGRIFAHEGAGTPAGGEQALASVGTWAMLGLGLAFGLKHATEVDHVVAVTAIVSEQRNLLRASLVGGLWGAGHTASLIVVGFVVLALRVAIPTWVADWLEFGVALMIIGLGASALTRALRRRSDVHVHRHEHGGGEAHVHIHFHEGDAEHHDAARPHEHPVTRIGFKPLVVGMAHGLAGSAALTLLVLTQVESVALGLLYLSVFGAGSIFGMLLMSSLVGLPFALSSRELTGINYGLQITAGILSIAFGLWYAYGTGVAAPFKIV